MRILGILGSLGAGSKNLALLELAASAAPAGVEVSLFTGLGALPHFDPDVVESPAPVLALRRAIAASDALLIAAPEYGHSLPGVLKNGIDWLIGTGELERKVIAITASVPGPERGRRGLAALRQTLGAVSATVVGGEPLVRGPGLEPALRALLEDLVEAARAHSGGR
jgi:NAD(P)H-dependent FMN reductase